LYLTDRLSPRGGAGNHLLDVVAAMAPRARLSVAAGQIQASLPDEVSTHRLRGLSASGSEAAGLSGLDELIADADVVHVQNLMNPVALRAAVASGRAVVTVQDHRIFCPGPGKTMPDGERCTSAMSGAACTSCLPDRIYRDRMLALTQARAAALRGAQLIVLSQYMADELAAAGLPGARIIPPHVHAAPAPSPAGQGFLIAGRLVHHKGIDLAAEAYRQAAVDAPLMLAGLGPMAAQVPEAKMHGWLDRAALRSALASARALLFPARWQEPFGIIALEALAAGTPVIAMVQGGMEAWADQGTIRVAPGDVEGMAAAIRRLHADPAHAAELGAAGWQMVQDRYAPAPLNDALWSIYSATA
jgi:glycosyltransferase involved in cell wall biosynthesis